MKQKLINYSEEQYSVPAERPRPMPRSSGFLPIPAIKELVPELVIEIECNNSILLE